MVRRLVATMAVAMLAGTGVVSLPAHAGVTTEASHWSGHQRVFPRLRGVVTSLSCPSADHCTATDVNGGASLFSGGSWHPVHTADHDLGALNSVSCATAGFCAAVGGSRAVVERAGVWRAVHVSRFHLRSVACAAASSCVAVGNGGRSLRYDGRWRSGARAGSQDLLAVSCPTTTSCLAVDAAGTSYRLRQGAWHRRGEVFTGSAPQGISLDCVSTTFCMAATDSARVARWDGRRWSRHKIFDDTRQWAGSVACSGPGFCAWGSSGGDLATWHHGWHGLEHHLAFQGGNAPALDCGGPRRCLLVAAGAGDGKGERDALAFRHGWHTAPSYGFRLPYGYFVSCAGVRSCMAVPYIHFPEVPSRHFDGRRWRPVTARGGQPEGDVSCPTSTFCAAIGGEGVTLWRGHGWSLGHRVGYGDRYSVSCSGPDFCLETSAFDDGNNSSRLWNGTSWTPAPGPRGFTGSLQCPAADDCGRWAARPSRTSTGRRGARRSLSASPAG